MLGLLIQKILSNILITITHLKLQGNKMAERNRFTVLNTLDAWIKYENNKIDPATSSKVNNENYKAIFKHGAIALIALNGIVSIL
jgi:hypothetical protein